MILLAVLVGWCVVSVPVAMALGSAMGREDEDVTWQLIIDHTRRPVGRHRVSLVRSTSAVRSMSTIRSGR